jgi:hypothetical protein
MKKTMKPQADAKNLIAIGIAALLACAASYLAGAAGKKQYAKYNGDELKSCRHDARQTCEGDRTTPADGMHIDEHDGSTYARVWVKGENVYWMYYGDEGGTRGKFYGSAIENIGAGKGKFEYFDANTIKDGNAEKTEHRIYEWGNENRTYANGVLEMIMCNYKPYGERKFRAFRGEELQKILDENGGKFKCPTPEDVKAPPAS